MEGLAANRFKTSQRGRVLFPRLKGWTGKKFVSTYIGK